MNPSNYNSLRLLGTRSLRIISEHEIRLDDIRPLGAVAYKDLVPQANDLNKVIELVFKVSEGLDNYRDVAEHFEFNPRQSKYYREAAEALGLVSSKGGKYYLTDTGRELVGLPVERRNLFFANLLADFRLISDALALLKERRALSRGDIENIIARRSNLSGSTVPRRAASLVAWLKWMSQATGSFHREQDGFRLSD